jgi:hypothetical protein
MNAEMAVLEAEAATAKTEVATEAEAEKMEVEAVTAVKETAGQISSVKRGCIVRAEGNR